MVWVGKANSSPISSRHSMIFKFTRTRVSRYSFQTVLLLKYYRNTARELGPKSVNCTSM